MKLTVKQIVGVYDKTKDGKPFVTKNGKSYKKATVTFVETGEKMVTVMVWNDKTCEIGQVFEGEIEEREWQGKKYYDLKVINEKQKQEDKIAQMDFSIANLDRKVKEIQVFLQGKYPKELKGVTLPPIPQPDFEQNRPQKEMDRDNRILKMHEDITAGHPEPTEEELNEILSLD